MIYDVIRRDSIEELVLAVNAYINSRWEPIGGIVGVRYGDGQEIIWCQAIVKRHPAEAL